MSLRVQPKIPMLVGSQTPQAEVLVPSSPAPSTSADSIERVATGLGAAQPLSPTVQIDNRLAVAVTYAQLGKHKLASRALAEARQLVQGFSQQKAAIGLHPGLWPQDASFESAFTRVEDQLKEAAKVVPPAANVANQKSTVLIFGLSANPPTGLGGHAGIVTWGANTLKVQLPNDAKPHEAREDVGIDQVWVLPVYRHIFNSKRKLLDYDHRKAMAQLAFEDLPALAGRVFVKDTERDVVTAAFKQAESQGESPQSVQVGTIDVMRKLMAEHPDKNFVLALGGDTFADLLAGKWKEGDALQKLVPIVVIPRKGVDNVAASEGAAPELTDISSTQVRGSTDVEFLRQALNPKVLDYMMSHKLYAFGEDATLT